MYAHITKEINSLQNIMPNQRKTLFISDLHLDASHPATAQAFLRFMQSLDNTVDALYILGDLFEAWIGDDDDSPFNQRMIEALREVTQRGIPVYFIHGNRDFLIGDRFLKATGCLLLQEETVRNVYGTRVLLMHGDTLCTLDTDYLRSRKKLRHPLVQRCFLMLPLFIRRKIANRMRNASQRYVSTATPEIMDVTQESVARVMQKHGVNTLIHGHTHRPAIHTFMLQQQHATRQVLGAWHRNISLLVWSESGNKKLIDTPF